MGLQKLNLLNRTTIVFRSSWNECDLPDFCHEKMVLRLGLEADLKVTLGLKKDTWQWQSHWFFSEADHRLVGGGWDRVCVARGGQDWAQARSQEDHHLQQVASTFSIYAKINFSHISELGTRISSPLSCWRSVSRATLSSGETAESIFLITVFPIKCSC